MEKIKRTTKKRLSIRITRCGFVAHCIFTCSRIYCFVEMLRMDVFVWVRCCYSLRHFFLAPLWQYDIVHMKSWRAKARETEMAKVEDNKNWKWNMTMTTTDYDDDNFSLTHTHTHIRIVSFNLHSQFTICHTLNSFVSHCSLCLFDTFGSLWKLRMYEKIFALFQPLRW